MLKGLHVVLVYVMLATLAHAKGWKERDVQACVCKGMSLEVTMPSGGRADCISETHAIEVDKTTKWAEAIGQSLYYAEQTDKKAKVILFCKQKRGLNCLKDRLRFEQTVTFWKLAIEYDIYGWADLKDICR